MISSNEPCCQRKGHILAQQWPIIGSKVCFTLAKHVLIGVARVRDHLSFLADRVWARIGHQVHTRVIIPATARYWQPIFGNIFPMLGQCWAVSNFELGYIFSIHICIFKLKIMILRVYNFVLYCT